MSTFDAPADSTTTSVVPSRSISGSSGRASPALPLVLIALVVIGGLLVRDCGSENTASESTIAGVVVDVTGTLNSVTSFTILAGDGTRLTLVPAEGLLFDGVGPLSHLRTHRLNGAPVSATYETAADGTATAVTISDAG